MQKLNSPFYLIHELGWSVECKDLVQTSHQIKTYGGTLGIKHSSKRFCWITQRFEEIRFNWIVRDILGNTVDPELVRDAVYKQWTQSSKPQPGGYQDRNRLKKQAHERGLPIPMFRLNFKSRRAIAHYIQHHRQSIGLQRDCCSKGEYYQYPSLKNLKKPNLKHEPYSDFEESRSNRNWKKFRSTQWKDNKK